MQFLNHYVPTRLAALRWVLVLHSKVPETLYTMLEELFPALLKTLSDPSDEVICKEPHFHALLHNSNTHTHTHTHTQRETEGVTHKNNTKAQRQVHVCLFSYRKHNQGRVRDPIHFLAYQLYHTVQNCIYTRARDVSCESQNAQVQSNENIKFIEAGYSPLRCR